MKIDTKNLISLKEANEDFSKVAKKVDQEGSAVILKDNKPKYIIVEYDETNYLALTDDEKIDIVAKRVLEKYRKAFEVLAQ